jgi:hypothetical protein
LGDHLIKASAKAVKVWKKRTQENGVGGEIQDAKKYTLILGVACGSLQ